MAVAGIDIGTSASVIAALSRGVVTIVRNEISERLTPSVVAFTDGERLVGDVAIAQLKSNFRNTCHNIKQLLGRHINEPSVQLIEREYQWAEICEAADGLAGYRVTYQGQETVLNASQVLATLLHKLREIAEESAGTAVRDFVVGVPGWFTDRHRRELLNAGQIAGINILRLMNEHTATALDYGIYRSNTFSEEMPMKVAFVCIGYATTYVTIAQFVKGSLKILGEATDGALGGRQFDSAIVKHFADDFKKKTKLDIYSNAKAKLKMDDQAEKTKKILSANHESLFSVECIMEEQDVSGLLNREQFEELCLPFVPRLKAILDRAVKLSGLSIDGITSIEIGGGCSRIPWVQEAIKSYFGKSELSRTLNADETVAKGCALMAAMISPAYRVRDFDVQDVSFSPIEISYDSSAAMSDSQGESRSVLYPPGAIFGTTKSITFNKNGPFDLEFFYGADASFPEGTPRDLGKYTVALPVSEEKQKTKVCVKLDHNGVFSVDTASQLNEEEYEATVKLPAQENIPASTENTKNDNSTKSPGGGADTATPMDVDAPNKYENSVAAEASTESPKEKETGTEAPMVEVKQKKKRTKKTPLEVTSALRVGVISNKTIQEYHEVELNMRNADRIALETKAKLNEVESYVYRMRDKLSESYKELVEPGKIDSLKEILVTTEDWLYDNFSASKAALVTKLDELKSHFQPIESRHEEIMERKEVLQAALTTIGDLRLCAMNPDEKYAHLDKDKKVEIVNESNKLEHWINDMDRKQRSMSKFEEPILKVKEIKEKIKKLEEFSYGILNQQKQASPKKQDRPPVDSEMNSERMGTQVNGSVDETMATDSQSDERVPTSEF